MRLLFVIYGSLDQISGGYLYDRRVIEFLERSGASVDCLQLPPCPYPLCPFQSLYAPLRYLFRGPLAGAGYDCIVIDELTHPSVFLPVARRHRPAAPVVLLLHHLKSRESAGATAAAARFMERILLRHVDAVIVNSRTTERTVRELIDPVPPLFVCPPGSDTYAGDRGAKGPEGGLRLLVTGNIIPRKGHDLLMRILGGLADLDWRLRIVGGAVDARFLRKVKRLAAPLGSRIDYTGVLAGDALQREYREADIFVFPSRYEGFGISLAEAIRAGLPFVAFASGAISEVSGGRGLLAAPGDLDTFRSHLRRLIEEPEFRGQMAALSRGLAAELPTWEDTGREFLGAVRRVVGEGS